MRYKLIAFLLSITLSCGLLAGCQSSPGSSAASQSAGEAAHSGQSSADGESQEDGDSITGQVTAIDGGSITLALGSFKGRGDGSFPSGHGSGTPPSGDLPDGTPPSGDFSDGAPPSGDFSDGTPPQDIGDGSSDGSTPDSNESSGNASTESGTDTFNGGTPPDGKDGALPDNGGGMGGSRGLTLTGEEKTLTIDDSVKITKESMGQSSGASLDDIEVDSILTVIMDQDTVVSVQIFDFSNGPKGRPDGSGDRGDTEEASGDSSSNVLL